MGGYAREYDIPDWEWPSFTYIFPVVVTAGPIFTVAVNDDREPTINEVQWSTLRRYFNSRDLRTVLRADVATFASLDTYLSQRVTATVDNARRVLEQNIHLYDPRWLLSNFGQPKQTAFFNSWLEAMRNEAER